MGKQSEAATAQGQQGKAEKNQQKESVGRSAIAHLLESSEAHRPRGRAAPRQEPASSPPSAFKGRLGAKAFEEKVTAHARPDGEHAQKLKTESDQGRAADHGRKAGGAERRRAAR